MPATFPVPQPERSSANRPAPSPANAPARDPAAVLEPLRQAKAAGIDLSAVGSVTSQGIRWEIPRVVFRGPAAAHDPIRLGLFAGLHGDEPAGCAALVQFALAVAAHPSRVAGYELFLYPVINPTGYRDGTRANHNGKDLNREFWRKTHEPEVIAIENELSLHEFAGIITLHADDTCEGVYGYAHGRTLNEALLVPALACAERFLPIDRRAVIDGFSARAGLICDCFTGVLAAPPEQRPKPFDVILETPANAPMELQVAASVAALESILAEYPGFISYGQDL